MHLIYRGIHYSSANNTETNLILEKPTVQLTYRGARYSPTNHVAVTRSAPIQKIARYRGNFYSLEQASNSGTLFNFKLRFLGATYNKAVLY